MNKTSVSLSEIREDQWRSWVSPTSGRYIVKLLNLKGLPRSVIDATDEVIERVNDRLGGIREILVAGVGGAWS